jgi:hypothetical protein
LYEKHVEEAHPAGTHKSFQCKICNNRFLLKYMLINHLKTAHNRKIDHLDDKFYSCYLCNEKFKYTARKNLIDHMQDHEEISHCSDCDISFVDFKKYDDHRERFHNDFSASLTRVDIPKRPVRKTISVISNRVIPVRPPEIKAVPKTPPRAIITKNELLVKPKPGKISAMPIKSKSPAIITPKIRVTTKAEQEAAKKPPEIKKILPRVVERKPEPEPKVEEEIVSAQPEPEPQPEPEQEQSQDSQNSTIVLPNNILVTEDGQIIIQNLEELMADQNVGDGQQSIINLEELLNQTNFVLHTDGEEGGEGTLVVQQGEDFIFQQEIPQQLVLQSGEDSQGTNSGEITIEGMELVNGDYNQDGQFVIQPEGQFTTVAMEEGESSGQEVVLQEVVVDEEAAQANQQTLDELSDILKEVAAQAEKPNLKRSAEDESIQRMKVRKSGSLEKRVVNPSVPDNNNFSNFSAAFQHFVQGFDAKKKFSTK